MLTIKQPMNLPATCSCRTRNRNLNSLLFFVFWFLFCQTAAPAATIETPYFRFTLQATNGDCEILDKSTDVTWRAETNNLGFGWVTINSEKRYRLTVCALNVNGNELSAAFYPYTAKPSAKVVVQIRALPDQ